MMTKERRADLEALADEDPHMCLLRELLNEIAELEARMAALRRFAERCAQRDHQPDEHIGSAKCVACEAEDALRANQGGAAT